MTIMDAETLVHHWARELAKGEMGQCRMRVRHRWTRTEQSNRDRKYSEEVYDRARREYRNAIDIYRDACEKEEEDRGI